jgi:hypothetical protein
MNRATRNQAVTPQPPLVAQSRCQRRDCCHAGKRIVYSKATTGEPTVSLSGRCHTLREAASEAEAERVLLVLQGKKRAANIVQRSDTIRRLTTTRGALRLAETRYVLNPLERSLEQRPEIGPQTSTRWRMAYAVSMCGVHAREYEDDVAIRSLLCKVA